MKRLMKQSLAAAVCVAGAGGALGQQAVTLDLDAAAAGTNRFDIAGEINLVVSGSFFGVREGRIEVGLNHQAQ